MTQMWLEILEQPKVFEKCLDHNLEKIRTVASILKERKINHVFIAARGTSDHAGMYAKYLAEIRLGIPVTLAAPSVFTIYNRNLKLDGSLVIGISQSGRAADVLEVIKKAREQGAVTVAITNNTESPLAQGAEFHLYCDAGVEKSVSATKTFTSQMYLLAQLIAEWGEDEELKKELSGVPELVKNTIDNNADYIKNLVQRYRFMNECFILARGMNYPIALETALKIQETSYVRARAYPISDFHHGPFAMIDNHTSVIVFAPEGPTFADCMEMLNKLRNAGADILVVSNDQEALSMGDCSITIPKAGEFTVPFANAAAAQIFACDLAVLKGLNPDTPRGLSKITITR